jgi:hypothetical protein
VPRFTAILQLALFISSLAAPFLSEDNEKNLPSCCRRAGLHRCMLMQRGTAQGPTFAGARCPSFPETRGFPVQAKTGLFPPAQSEFAQASVSPSIQVLTEARYGMSHGRTRDVRGPPVLLS